MSFPNTPHDWALWLFATLEDVQAMGGDSYRGRLPDTYDYQAVHAELDRRGGSVGGGLADETSRLIEFSPNSGHVYQTLDQLVSTPANQERAPAVFTVRDLGYTSPAEPVPESVQAYLHTVQLWALMTELADHIVRVPASLFFIQSPIQKVELTPKVDSTGLKSLPGLAEFSRDYVRSDFHKEHKRDIVRSALIETFAGKTRVTLGAVIDQFDAFFEQVKASFAVFAADFSYQKIRTEIEKQNLDDTLRLNKTLADIQNQLLALPAALVLSASGLEAGKSSKNIAIVVGAVIFGVLMLLLVLNQKNSVRSIGQEVALRKSLVEKQPAEVASRFQGAFGNISARVTKQDRTLNMVLLLVGIVVGGVVWLAARI